MEKLHFDSICVHDLNETLTTKPHQLPIYATSSFDFVNLEQGEEIFTGRQNGHVYGRYGNPTIDAVANKIAALETYGSELEGLGLMTSSGMSAISTLMMGLLQSGDSILAQGNLYGGTTELFIKILMPLGIGVKLMDLNDLDLVETTLKSDATIKMIYFETPSNPTLDCIDIENMVALAKKYHKITCADNTFATPYLQQPLILGVDYVIHSTTKYLNGHGNSITGAIVGTDPVGMKRVWTALKLVGTNCNPFDAWLTYMGMKTLPLRMDKQCANATALANFLSKSDKVLKVNYLSLDTHRHHHLACKQMKNFGAMMSFELHGGLEAGRKFMNSLKLCSLAPTLGDVDTLILHPATMSHINVAKSIREQNGITDGLIRVSVGIEAIEDLIQDMERGLS